LLPAMNVPSLCVEAAMSMRGGRAVRRVPSARFGTSVTKV